MSTQLTTLIGRQEIMFALGIECGRVKFFTTKEGKNFGFIERPGMPNLHFHHDNGCGWKFISQVYGMDPEQKPSRFAQGRDTVYYIEAKAKKGQTAIFWALSEDLERFVASQQDRVSKPQEWEAVGRPHRDLYGRN